MKDNSPLNPRLRRTVINWGNAHQPPWAGAGTVFLNNPRAVTTASCKLASFRAFQGAGVTIPEFTTDRRVALQWLTAGVVVVARTVLRGSSGIGIHIAENAQDRLVEAPLYVKYVKKLHEYRVHVFNGQVIDTQIKRKKNGVERDTTRIRNLANGYIFARDGIVAHLPRDTVAIAAVAALGLDFGAVDLIWNRLEDKYYVLEVNSAPGLEGTTLTNYTNAIRNYR